MNFHVYLDEDLGRQLEKLCLTTHKKQNTIVREALRLYLYNSHFASRMLFAPNNVPDCIFQAMQKKKVVWPDSVLSFKGMADFPSFESLRDEFS